MNETEAMVLEPGDDISDTEEQDSPKEDAASETPSPDSSETETSSPADSAAEDEAGAKSRSRPRRQPAFSGPPPCDDTPLETRIEALLLSTDKPLTDGRLAELLGHTEPGSTKDIRAAIESLNRAYEKEKRAFRIESVAGGRQMLTLPSFGPLLARLHEQRQQQRLTPAALETLAIVAYRQPILRADIEAIRGVACGEVLRGLMERRLIRIAGRAEELGRPILYGTTREFLHVFGLASLDDLPESKELRQPGEG